MLPALDKALTGFSWLLAAVVAVMLLIGPRVVAHDSAKETAAAPNPYGSASGPSAAPTAATPDGKTLFTQNCGSCHTLKAAGTSGIVGPNLDDLAPDAKTVEDAMKNGPGAMPEFGKTLKSDQVRAIAEFVASR